MFTQGDLMLKSFDFKHLGSLLLQTWVTSFTRGECVFNMDGFEVVTASILLSSIVALGIVTYWSLQQIRELKDQINTCE